MEGKGSAPAEGAAGVPGDHPAAAQKPCTRRAEAWERAQRRTCSSPWGFMPFDQGEGRALIKATHVKI